MLIRPLTLSTLLPALLLVGQAATAGNTETAPAAAAEQGREVPMRRHRFDEINRRQFIEEHDMNGDDQVSLVEFIDFREQRFAGGDSNRDGYLDEAEYVEEYTVRLDRRLARERRAHVEQTQARFNALDRNDDGVIDREEFRASSDRIFSRLDPEGTGRIVHLADNDEDQARRGRRNMLRMPTTHRLEGFMTLYDVNATGEVTREQFDALRAAQFDATDAHGDGGITRDEYQAEFESRLDRQAERVREDQISRTHVRFGAVDLDGDGRIDLSEYLRVGLRTFQRWDITGAGVVRTTDPVPEPADAE